MDRGTIINEIDAAQQRIELDLVIENITVLDVFQEELYISDVAIYKDKIVGVGNYKACGKKVIDGTGKYITPSFIDTHVHIESSLVPPHNYAKTVVKHGVTTIIADPHEIANVAGKAGIDFMLSDAKESDVDIYFSLPSCVPATPFEQGGAKLFSQDLEEYYSNKWIIGLGEMMNYPGVLAGDSDVVSKISSARNYGKICDGHIAGISDDRLNAYIGAGITTDHECVTIHDAKERVKRGMHVLIREGTSTKDVEALIPAVNDKNCSMFAFCTDDRHLDEIMEEGTIRNNVRKAIKLGMKAEKAYKIATINAAKIYKIEYVGAIAPGYFADFLILDNLEEVAISSVYRKGESIVENGVYREKIRPSYSTLTVPLRFHVEEKDFDIHLEKGKKVNIIEIIPNTVVTKKIVEEVDIEKGQFVVSHSRKLSKLAVINRYGSKNIGLGIIKGIDIKSGAIATTISHDSHNVIVLGTNSYDMKIAAESLKESHGGLVVVSEGKVIGKLELEIGGLMTNQPIDIILNKMEKLHESMHTICGENDFHIFLTLAFMSLPVIPEIKLTEKGLFDVTKFQFMDLIAE
ncbi:MAG: adenine deaminase [Fusobacteria bacterium]|nr:adenine deaminase [Fusobacteriota bacterium]